MIHIKYQEGLTEWSLTELYCKAIKASDESEHERLGKEYIDAIAEMLRVTPDWVYH
jgi:hypothetical protein